MKNKNPQPGKRLLSVTSILFLVLSGLFLLLSALLGMVGGGEWFGLARSVALLLLLSAAWNLALGIAGLVAGRRAGRGFACIVMGSLSLTAAAALLVLSVLSVLNGQSPAADEAPLMLLLLPWLLLSAFYLAGAIRNRRAGRPAGEGKERR